MSYYHHNIHKYHGGTRVLSENNSSISAAHLVKSKRGKLRMTQKELADAVGMSKYGDRTIRRWESGETKPSALELSAILDFPENPPFPNPTKAPFKSIDLFAGIGGTRLGFAQTGMVENVFTSEIDKFSRKTYFANFGEEAYGDITEIDPRDIPDHDILIGGFPCQAFSQAGKKLGFKDARGTLFFQIAKILDVKRPKSFLLENVRNLKSHNQGQTFSHIKEILDELNYEVYVMQFKSRDFGVPQNRERIYIVGFERDKVKNYESFNAPIPFKTPTCVGDILQTNVDPKYTISDKLWQGHQRRKVDNKKNGKGFGYSLFSSKSEYTNTISARYYKDGSEILIEQEGKNPRKITPREAARLQGFPEEFIIAVSDTQAYKQFGNSVSVPVVNAVAHSIINVLNENNGSYCALTRKMQAVANDG